MKPIRSTEDINVKKTIAVILLVLLALMLTACQDDNQETNENANNANAVNVNATPTPAPTPVPTATPFPRVPVENYVMIWKSNPNRGINYMVPTHWEQGEQGERYITYYEPVPSGETGFRVSYTNKKMKSEQDSGKMRNELRELLDHMKNSYDQFETDGTISRDYSLVRFRGFHSYYTFVDEYGVKIKGFAIMATYNRRIYCMTFQGPESRFDEMAPIGTKMMDSMNRS